MQHFTLVWSSSPALLQTALDKVAFSFEDRSRTGHRSEGRRTRNVMTSIKCFSVFHLMLNQDHLYSTPVFWPCAPLWWGNPLPVHRRPLWFSPEPGQRQCGAGSWAAAAACWEIWPSGRSLGPADKWKHFLFNLKVHLKMYILQTIHEKLEWVYVILYDKYCFLFTCYCYLLSLIQYISFCCCNPVTFAIMGWKKDRHTSS